MVVLDIELPDDDDEAKEDSIFSGRIDFYEAYWLHVDGVRYVGAALDQSGATEEDRDRSPLARHYIHFYDKKEEYKQKCLDLPGTLPKYKDEFKEPRGEVREVSDKEMDDLEIPWSEGDDPIWLPPEYELPDVWEGNLENKTVEELHELINQLRSEKEELQTERDKLKNQLGHVREVLNGYLNSESPEKEEQKTEADSTCEKCGETFDTPAAKNGHKGHCDGSITERSQGRDEQSEKETADELATLAKELPEMTEGKTSNSQKEVGSEKELENLNHLLQGSL